MTTNNTENNNTASLLPFIPARFESLKHITKRNFEFAHHRVNELVEKLSNELGNFYLFLSKNDAWETELVPPEARDRHNEWIDLWNEMNILYKIMPRDITLGIRRIDWTAGTVYDEYDDSINLIDKDFYVITDEFNIYKCISNNQRSPSVIKPRHTDTNIFKTTDGYKWKFMKSVSSAELNKFYIREFIPLNVPKAELITSILPGSSDLDTLNKGLITRLSAINGAIEHLVIEEKGNNYRKNADAFYSTEIPIFIEGNGKQNASAKCKIEAHEGFIYSISIYNPGLNYTFSHNKKIPIAIRQYSEKGVIQTSYGLARTDPGGQILEVELIVSGNGYTTGSASIVSSSCNAYAETDEFGSITNSEVYLGQSGSQFTRAKAIIIDSSGINGRIRPIISPSGGHGSDLSKELFAGYAMINVRLYGDFENDFVMLDSFRRIGIIENPEESDEYYYEDAQLLSKSWSLIVSENLDILEIVSYHNPHDYVDDDYVVNKHIGSNNVTTTYENISDTNNLPKEIIDPFFRRDDVLYCKNKNYTNVLVRGSINGPVWGNNFTGYTDNSDWNAAAVHAGIVKVNESAIISRIPIGLRSQFTGTISNHVFSQNYNDTWCGVKLQRASFTNTLNDYYIDAKYRIEIESTDFHLFKDNEDIIGLTSGVIGYSIQKYRDENILRVTIKDSEFLENNENRLKVGEWIIGKESNTKGKITSIVVPKIKRYSGTILHYNNIAPIQRSSEEQIEVITLVLNYLDYLFVNNFGDNTV